MYKPVIDQHQTYKDQLTVWYLTTLKICVDIRIILAKNVVSYLTKTRIYMFIYCIYLKYKCFVILQMSFTFDQFNACKSIN